MIVLAFPFEPALSLLLAGTKALKWTETTGRRRPVSTSKLAGEVVV